MIKIMSQTVLHRPVLLLETLAFLNIREHFDCFDGTGGAGGFSKEIKKLLKSGRLVTVDMDPEAIKVIEKNVGESENNFIIKDSFENIDRIIESVGIEKVNAAVLDLGLSSYALDTPERGFSHRFDAKLDMRFDKESGDPPASEVIKNIKEEELVKIIALYGEQPGARRIAKAIKKELPQTTRELSDIVSRLVRRDTHEKSLSRVFMALRIYVNRELERLRKFFDIIPDCMTIGGRLAVISYHSLEDRIVKEFFQRESKDCICPPEYPVCVCQHRASFKIITKKPVRPDISEIESNSRARSALLRVGERIK